MRFNFPSRLARACLFFASLALGAHALAQSDDEASKKSWIVIISMKSGWKRVFAFE